MSKKTYEVWHQGGNAGQFPQDFTHVANVQANGLLEAVNLTREEQFSGNWLASEDVELVGVPDSGTERGDVIIDPSGRPFLVEERWFKEFEKDAQQYAVPQSRESVMER